MHSKKYNFFSFNNNIIKQAVRVVKYLMVNFFVAVFLAETFNFSLVSSLLTILLSLSDFANILPTRGFFVSFRRQKIFLNTIFFSPNSSRFLEQTLKFQLKQIFFLPLKLSWNRYFWRNLRETETAASIKWVWPNSTRILSKGWGNAKLSNLFSSNLHFSSLSCFRWRISEGSRPFHVSWRLDTY